MPLPLLIPIVLAGTAGAAGVVKFGKGIVNFNQAKKINERANLLINDTKYALNKARKECNKSLAELGEAKINILNEGISRFIAAFERIKNYEFDDTAILNDLGSFIIDKAGFTQLKNGANYATSIASGLLTGSVSGAMVAYGAYSSVALMGATASTNITIASLSGIAAQNATLAWLGGGTLASGGGGVAAGSMVLGGIALAPALLIGGLIINAKGTKALNEAKANEAKANQAAKQLNVARTLCNGITNRSKMFIDLLDKLNKIFLPLVTQMEETIKVSGTDYSTYNTEQKHGIAKAYAIAGAIKSILDTPILTKEGQLTSESGKVVKEIKQLIM